MLKHNKKVETQTVSTSMPRTNRCLFHSTSAASDKAGIPQQCARLQFCNKTRSSPGIQAETPISKLPYTQKPSRSNDVSDYSALFANPVKSTLSYL